MEWEQTFRIIAVLEHLVSTILTAILVAVIRAAASRSKARAWSATSTRIAPLATVQLSFAAAEKANSWTMIAVAILAQTVNPGDARVPSHVSVRRRWGRGHTATKRQIASRGSALGAFAA